MDPLLNKQTEREGKREREMGRVVEERKTAHPPWRLSRRKRERRLNSSSLPPFWLIPISAETHPSWLSLLLIIGCVSLELRARQGAWGVWLETDGWMDRQTGPLV